jgi:hypothetical protein
LSRILVCDLCNEEIDESLKPQDLFVTESEGGFKVEIKPPDNMDLCPACMRVGYARAAKTAWHENKQERRKVKGDDREN